MAENKKSPKGNKPIKIRFGISWLYIILFIAIGYMFFNQGGAANPQKEEWADVQQQWLDGDIKEVVFIRNEYEGRVTIKPDKIEKYADKFKPSTGLKIKESNIAGRMENATRNAAYGGQKQEKQWAKKRTQPRANKNNSNIRSYKWF